MNKKYIYKSVINHGSFKESVSYEEKGTYHYDQGNHVVKFVSNGEKFEISYNDHHVSLKHGQSNLFLSTFEEIENNYVTQYGVMHLTTRVLKLESAENKLSLIYELVVQGEVVSTVYIMLRGQELSDEA